MSPLIQFSWTVFSLKSLNICSYSKQVLTLNVSSLQDFGNEKRTFNFTGEKGKRNAEPSALALILPDRALAIQAV